MSVSRVPTSGSCRGNWSTASRPVRSDATIFRPGSSLTQRETRPRTTTASSTIMTRIGSCAVAGAAGARMAATLIHQYSLRGRYASGRGRSRSDQPDFLELGFDDFLVERLHDVFVRAGAERTR